MKAAAVVASVSGEAQVGEPQPISLLSNSLSLHELFG